jgi:serine/threonine-protein kinase RsbW
MYGFAPATRLDVSSVRTAMNDPDNGAAISFDAFLESTLESVDQAEDRITAIANSLGFPEEEVFRIGMAVREAMVNAVVHGNRYSADKRVHLAAGPNAGRLEIRIVDQGTGFQPRETPDPTSAENLLKESGRGMMIIRSFVDEFLVESASPAGARVILRKALPGPA